MQVLGNLLMGRFADGLFLCNATARRLEAVLSNDVRVATGAQAFVTAAPVSLVYVADFNKTGGERGRVLPRRRCWFHAWEFVSILWFCRG